MQEILVNHKCFKGLILVTLVKNKLSIKYRVCLLAPPFFNFLESELTGLVSLLAGSIQDAGNAQVLQYSVGRTL
jgi:hypothetical protein